MTRALTPLALLLTRLALLLIGSSAGHSSIRSMMSNKLWRLSKGFATTRPFLVPKLGRRIALASFHHMRGGADDSSSSQEKNASPTQVKEDVDATIIQRDYKILSNETVYSNYRAVILRKVEHNISKKKESEAPPIESNSASEGDRSTNVVTYDLITHKGTENVVVVFAWNSTSKTVTLVEEYHPGAHSRLFGPAAGLVDPIKHRPPSSTQINGSDEESSMAEIAARWELEEELRLRGGTWHKLSEKPIYMDKYTICRVYPFLCIDPLKVSSSSDSGEVILPRDKEEEHDIEIVENISVPKMVEMINIGQMNLVGSWTALLALEKLRELNEL